MKHTTLDIKDLIIIEPEVYKDDRGFFYESFNTQSFFKVVGLNVSFLQDNHSFSKKNVLRGLHFQKEPKPQSKLVRVISGKIFDVAVDIRKDSPTFLQWRSVILSAENKKQFWIPDGFAHGFLTLSDYAEVCYKASNNYDQNLDDGIIWNDSLLNIDWPQVDGFILSDKDKNLKESKIVFNL